MLTQFRSSSPLPFFLPTIVFLVLTCSIEVNAQATAERPQLPSKAYTDILKAEFDHGEYEPRFPDQSKWLDGGERYTILEQSAANKDQTDLVAYEAVSGKRSVLVAAKQLIPAGGKSPLDVNDYSWSADNSSLLTFTNSQKVWRRYTRGDYWLLRLSDGKLTQLGKSVPAASMMFCKFSPDGKSVAYVSRNNIYVESSQAIRFTS
jgi:dipeptidyl-peptidase-4